MSEGWPVKNLRPAYGSTDHLTRANFEADVHRFGYGKTQFQVLQLNQLVKDSKNFAAFKTEAAKVLTNLNERHLKTEFDTAKATSVSTANVLRAVADGAKFMRHRATMDTHTRPVHAALNNKVWRIDNPNDTEWRKWVSPLSWSCRCIDIYTDEAEEADIITATQAEQLLGNKEVDRLTKDGFLIDRLDKKTLFSSKQSYLNGLADPEQLKFSIGKLKYSEQGQQPWKDVSQAQLSPYNLPNKSKQDVISDFTSSAADKRKVYTDYSGRPLFLSEKDLLNHLKPKYLAADENRQSHYFTIGETVADPDEVYFFDKSVDAQQGNPAGPHGKLSYLYLKFYQDNTVLAAVVEFDKILPQSLRTWYQVKPDRIDEARRGLLIHKK